MSDTTNYYTVITKWSKKNKHSPGYKSGFFIANILAQNKEDRTTLLQDEGILSTYFNEEIYKRWAEASMAVANLGIVSAFVSVSSEDHETSYSLALYETKESEELARTDNPEIFKELYAAKEAFINLMDLDVEVKKLTKGFTDDEFFEIAVREITFERIESIFNEM